MWSRAKRGRTDVSEYSIPRHYQAAACRVLPVSQLRNALRPLAAHPPQSPSQHWGKSKLITSLSLSMYSTNLWLSWIRNKCTQSHAFLMFVILSYQNACYGWENRKSNLLRMFLLWRTKVSEVVCKRDWQREVIFIFQPLKICHGLRVVFYFYTISKNTYFNRNDFIPQFKSVLVLVIEILVLQSKMRNAALATSCNKISLFRFHLVIYLFLISRNEIVLVNNSTYVCIYIGILWGKCPFLCKPSLFGVGSSCENE